MFYFSVPEKPDSKVMEKVSGLMNVPKKAGIYPVIVMFRGFVPDDMYKPGIGTQPSAQVFVSHGFITLAPDFLGYGESASPSADPFENRFQTYTTALTLLASLPNLNSGLKTNYSGTISADLNKIGIWGHSNGGHIALSVLEISGLQYPTVLWAPVSASFPYSILYYTDESDDQGKALRQTLSGFEKIYDTDQFSLTNYFNWIKAPIEINQGTADQEVPVWWSDNLVDIFKKDNISVKYITYPGADHNLLPSGWSDAVSNSIDFYNQQFSKL
jgi:dipeptidyl aminopeptidase/acylaminoacyl peptidase